MTLSALFTQLSRALSSATLYRVCSLIVTLLAALFLPIAEFGQLITMLALFQLIAIGFNLGFDLWLQFQPTKRQTANSTLSARVGLGCIWVLGLVWGLQRLALPMFPTHLLVLGGAFMLFESILSLYFVWAQYSQRTQQSFYAMLIVITLTVITTIGLFTLPYVTLTFVIFARIAPIFAGLGYIFVNRDIPARDVQTFESQTPYRQV